jgi:preprotein translocase subunit SecE
MLVTMTNTKEPENTAGALDTAMLAAASLCVIAGVVAYYYFEDAALLLRVFGVIAGVVLGSVLVYRTQQGQLLWRFIQGSRVEIRKVVWPTRQETTQTTLAVVVFVLVLGIFFWGLDFVLLLITRAVTGQGG